MILTGSTWQEVIVGPRLLWLVSAASVLAPEESAFPGDLPAVVLFVLHRARNRPTYRAETLIRHCSRMVDIVLRGALADGSRGLAAIHAAGGSTMVVSPAGPSKGMPENAIQYDGPISYVGRPEAIGAAVCRLVQGEGLALSGGPSDTDAAR